VSIETSNISVFWSTSGSIGVHAGAPLDPDVGPAVVTGSLETIPVTPALVVGSIPVVVVVAVSTPPDVPSVSACDPPSLTPPTVSRNSGFGFVQAESAPASSSVYEARFIDPAP
jgi:hypothetical protein